jgi:hypothetical protein
MIGGYMPRGPRAHCAARPSLNLQKETTNLKSLKGYVSANAARRPMIVLVAILLSAIGTVGTASPATAGNGDHYQLINVAGNDCLDSNGSVNVYMHFCNGGTYQRWYLWMGGWVKHYASANNCLTIVPGPPNPYGFSEVANLPCVHEGNGIPSQMWEQWSGGWIRNPHSGRCVMRVDAVDPTTGRVGTVITAPCDRWASAQYWTQT